MSAELIHALEQIEKEKGIQKEVLKEITVLHRMLKFILIV